MSAFGNTLQNFWSDEPVITLIGGIGLPVQAFLFLLIQFGYHFSAEQIIAINTFLAAFLTWITRRNINSPTNTAAAIDIALRTNPSRTAAADVAASADVKIPTQETP